MTRSVVIQHLAPEGPARISAALERTGVSVEVVRVDLGDRVPEDVGGVGGVVVMGGPMSARSDDGFATRCAELELLRAALEAEVPVLGICLGAQLLAVAAGGSVRPGDGPEIGWGSIELTPAAAQDPVLQGLPDRFDVLHWHGETYDLPDGAVHLARSERYSQQAFRVGSCAWGLQFHLEVDPPDVARFVDSFPEDAAFADGGGAGIVTASVDAVRRLAPHREAVLDRFAAIVAGRQPP